jgi:hypothetical protein
MPSVAGDVTGPLNAVAALTQGLAAKNQTMKDGPAPSTGGTQEKKKSKPSAADNKSAYDQYKKDVQNAWQRNTLPDVTIADEVSLWLDIGQAVADLAINGGPQAIKAIGDILNPEKKGK